MRLQHRVAGDKEEEELVEGGASVDDFVQQLPRRQLPVQAVRLGGQEPVVEGLRPRARVVDRARVLDHRGRRGGKRVGPPRVVVNAKRTGEAVTELVGTGGREREAPNRDAPMQRVALPFAVEM